MNKTRYLAVCSIFLSCGLCKADSSVTARLACVVVKNAVCRTAPYKKAAVLAHYHRGDAYYIVGERNGYYCIPFGGYNGYVAKWMMAIVPSPDLSHVSTHDLKAALKSSPAPSDDAMFRQALAAKGLKIVAFPPPAPVSTSYYLAPAQDYDGRVAFADTQNHWYKVEACGGSVHFKNAGAGADNQFSAEIAIDGSILLKPTSKPVAVDFVVTLYDRTGNLVTRDNVTIFNVQSSGGEYVLAGPTVPYESKPYSCSIKFSSAWTSRN